MLLEYMFLHRFSLQEILTVMLMETAFCFYNGNEYLTDGPKAMACLAMYLNALLIQ